MKFKVFSELTYEVSSTTTFIFNIQAARTNNQYILEESIVTTPILNFQEFSIINSEARFIRMEVNAGITFTITYNAVVDVYHTIVTGEQLGNKVPVMQLDPVAIPYLFPSRHCQSDKLTKLAQKEFGHLENAYSQASAVNEWIYSHIEYLSGTTNSGTSAYDTLTQREGVCKDFAHLGIALCRALDIPARYFTGYACDLVPPDFHACFEAYIGGQWMFFDATKLVPVNGLVKIANSKDAAEAAVASYFGNSICTYMNIQCEPAEPGFIPYILVTGKMEGISYR
ncbi:MAG: transglutaminase family protein [Ferruginibacter sp.]